MFNNYGPRQNPRYVTGTIITQALARETIELGNLEPLRDFCFCTDGVRGHLTVAAHGTPGDVYVYGQGENISMDGWVDLILRIGEENGFWPAGRDGPDDAEQRYRPGASDVMALRVGHEKLTRETGWEPKVSWEEGVLQTIRWYAENRERWIGRVDWLPTGSPTLHAVSRSPRHRRRRLPRLPPRGASRARTGHHVAVPRRWEFDLTDMAQTARLFEQTKPELVFHLAAEVGGIGANRANPGRYWYANLMMGAHVLEQARLHDDAQARARRHRLRVPQVHAGAVPGGRPVERISRGDERSVRRREEGGAGRSAGVPRAVRARHDLPAADEPLRTARQLRPADLPRDPGADPQDDRVAHEIVLWGDGTPTREYLYVDDCVDGLVLAAERYDGAEPVNLGTGVETSIRETAEIVADAVGFTGEIRWDTSMPNGQPRRSLDASQGRGAVRLPAHVPLRDGIARTVAWYRAHPAS